MFKYVDIDHEIQEMQQVIDEHKNSHTFENEIASHAFKLMIEKFQSLPPADVAPVVHAKWIKLRHQMYTCSRCKRSIYLEGLNVTDENETSLLRELYPYCNCGAKMDER